MLARSGFFQKCSKRWLFPSMQDAVEHAKHGLPLVSLSISHSIVTGAMPTCLELLVGINFALGSRIDQKVLRMVLDFHDSIFHHQSHFEA